MGREGEGGRGKGGGNDSRKISSYSTIFGYQVFFEEAKFTEWYILMCVVSNLRL